MRVRLEFTLLLKYVCLNFYVLSYNTKLQRHKIFYVLPLLFFLTYYHENERSFSIIF